MKNKPYLLDVYPALQAISPHQLKKHKGKFTSGLAVDQVSAEVVSCFVYTDGTHSLDKVDESKTLLTRFQIGYIHSKK